MMVFILSYYVILTVSSVVNLKLTYEFYER